MKDKYREMVGLKRNPKRLKKWKVVILRDNEKKPVKRKNRPDVYS